MIILIYASLHLCFGFGQNFDSSFCPCDLKTPFCDVNCCCDSECSTEDIRVFSHCENTIYALNKQYCIKPGLVLFNSSPYETSKDDLGLMCILKDNNQGANYYEKVPDAISSTDEFTAIKQKYAIITDYDYIADRSTKIGAKYKHGDKVMAVMENGRILFDFQLPNALYSNFCSGMTPIYFLTEFSAKCQINWISFDSNSCQNLAHIKASSYYEGILVISSPKELLELLTAGLEIDEAVFNLSTENLIRISIEDGSSTELPIWDPSSNSCKNVINKIRYIFTLNAMKEILQVSVFISQTNVDDTDDPKEPFIRSGNPGYLMNRPIMAGSLKVINNSSKTIELDNNPTNWMTIFNAMNCDENQRQTVSFGREMLAGCLIELSPNTTIDECTEIQQRVLFVLRIPSINRVASFANANINKTDDWVEILTENFPEQLPKSDIIGSCPIINGLEILIVYANVGALVEPQAKIVGVLYRYKIPQEIRVPCLSEPYCPSQKIPIITTVSYIDISEPLFPGIAEIPTLLNIRLPADFFYPFTGYSSRVESYPRLLVYCIVCIVCIVYCQCK